MEEQKKILVIEDNEEVREFICLCLQQEYIVEQALNGLDGWATANTLLPDLIITDVMMPKMDGNELCKKIKTDERTSHIPVIMLTAKAAVEQQIEGIENGADVYLTKPFNIQVLQSYVKSILRSKELIRQRYSQKVLMEPASVEIGTVDKRFMERLMNVIDQRLRTSEFNISDLAREIGMSKAVLYKKFSALVHMPIGEFIKSLRLKKAALLLGHDKFTIAE
ncbi:MAG: response regulator, partial [Chitinophagaceae bacterium]|nr:response regulator [Chitinophagaceae bacterium]